MNTAMSLSSARSEDNERIVAAVVAQGPRLRDFVRRRVADLSEVEDIVQDTFVEMICAYRLMEPIEHLAAWLRRVARNRIIDRFRRRSRAAASSEPSSFHGEGSDAEQLPLFDEWFAPVGAEPEASYVREVLAEELVSALDALPPDQRAVFVAHELDGRSFKELAIETGVGINTLLGRKHAAVRQLRRGLHDIRAEFDT
jgi:RNA polymerase sigma factor (sigma-70 family)